MIKPIEDFGKDKTKRTRVSSHCLKCRAYAEKLRRQSPEVKDRIRKFKQDPINKRKTKDLALKRLFGITIEEFEIMKLKQNNLCAICYNPQKDKLERSLVVDHCHKTGKVRALLCTPCNQGIGHFHDNIEKLKSAINYLEKHT